MRSMDTPLWIWIAFNAGVLALLALDLGLFHREHRAIPVREAIRMCLSYAGLALIFNIGVYLFHPRPEAALEFLTGYVVEYALSMDNIMVFVMLIAHFQVPAEYQFRVLAWGIIGALVLRAIFIFAGAALISQFGWILVLFGAFLIFTGIKSFVAGGPPKDLKHSRIMRFSRRAIPMTPDYDADKFFVKENGKRLATPLVLLLIVLNLTDILFAVDSIPAIFGITRDPFIVYTSNVFALLGLRALYFAMAGALEDFHFLRHGVSLVLVLIGGKLVGDYFTGGHIIPTVWMLLLTAGLIGGSIVLSILRPREKASPGSALE
jgi:tellurite resistance protein TerC